MGQCTSILLVGKPGHVRDALAGLIDSLPCTTMAQSDTAPHLICACDGRQAVELARENLPTLVLFVGAPFETAAALDEIHRAVPQARCLVLTEAPNPLAEISFSSADAVLPIGAPFDLLKATIEGLLSMR